MFLIWPSTSYMYFELSLNMDKDSGLDYVDLDIFQLFWIFQNRYSFCEDYVEYKLSGTRL